MKHIKKMIAPIIISIIIVIYYIVYFYLLIALLDVVWKYILGIIPIVLSGVMIAVCIERIKEIKRGKEDDLSEY